MQSVKMKSSRRLCESILILNENGIIQWASSSITDLLEYFPDEIIGKDIFNLLSRVSLKRIKQIYKEVHNDPSLIREGMVQFIGKHREKTPLFITVSSISGLQQTDSTLIQLRQFNTVETASNISSLLDAVSIEIELRKKIEREIAAELHDHVSSGLAGVKLMLDHSLRDITRHHVNLQEVSIFMADIIRDVRNLSHIIKKRAVQDFQLYETLHLLIEKFSKIAVLRIVLRYDKKVEDLITNSQKIQIARIIQEQVLNIIRHAHATKVLISIQYKDGKIIAITRDNGKGFDPEKNRDGIGISNMYHRANVLGGNMFINSKCGEGTTIAITFPLD